MSSANQISRFGALALSATAFLLAAALGDPDPAGQAQAASGRGVASLVSLTDRHSRDRLTGPRAPLLPAGGSQLVPTGVPPEVERLAARVLPARAPARFPARFPVEGPFTWGEQGARFGAGRGGHVHAGQDVFGRAGTPLVAVRDGVVLEQGEGGGRGNYVAIYDPPARRTYVYLHLQGPARVRAGQPVAAGRRIGELGCTGSCFGDHLHFEIRRGRGLEGTPLDPLPDLKRWAR